MQDFYNWLKDIDPVEAEAFRDMDEVSGDWFCKRGLPMIVECTCCGSTMALPSAYIDENGYVFCSGCANSP